MSEQTPKRIQRQRTKGWRMPENTVYVGRPTKWGNHHRVGAPDPIDGEPMGPNECVYHFWRYIERVDWTLLDECRTELRGKNLACWCPLDQPCHADVLLELANAPTDLNLDTITITDTSNHMENTNG